ncbi:MAG: hypothetical protein HQ559_07315 [Lentisphaerae bacterium]|nr:hypothetical protein [Lentisphaerota bacterium]
MIRKLIVCSLCMAAPVVGRAAWDGFPLADTATNYFSWSEMIADLSEHPFQQLVLAYNERAVAAGASPIEIVESHTLGPATNETTVTLTNTWGYFTTNGMAGYASVEPDHFETFDSALLGLIPSFWSTNERVNGCYTGWFNKVASEFPAESRAGLFSRQGIGFVTNTTTNAIGFITGGEASFTFIFEEYTDFEHLLGESAFQSNRAVEASGFGTATINGDFFPYGSGYRRVIYDGGAWRYAYLFHVDAIGGSIPERWNIGRKLYPQLFWYLALYYTNSVGVVEPITNAWETGPIGSDPPGTTEISTNCNWITVIPNDVWYETSPVGGLDDASFYIDRSSRPVLWYDSVSGAGGIPAVDVTIIGFLFSALGYVDIGNVATETVSIAAGDVYTPSTNQFHTPLYIEPDDDVGAFGDVIRLAYTNEDITLYRSNYKATGPGYETWKPNVLQAAMYDERWRAMDALRVTGADASFLTITSRWFKAAEDDISHIDMDTAWTEQTANWLTNGYLYLDEDEQEMYAWAWFPDDDTAIGWSLIPVARANAKPYAITNIAVHVQHSAQFYVAPWDAYEYDCDLLNWFEEFDGITTSNRLFSGKYYLMETQAEATAAMRYSVKIDNGPTDDDNPVEVLIPSTPVDNAFTNTFWGMKFDDDNAFWLFQWDGANGFSYK